MRKYHEPSFGEPLSSSFVYAAWSIDPLRAGPFVRSSAVRAQQIDKIRGVALELAQRPAVEGVHVFESSFIPPLPGMPTYDVAMVVRARTSEGAVDIRDDAQLQELNPATVFSATNAARFGDTENPGSGVNILLNHFAGPPDRSAAVDTWRQISRWYVTKTGVDNSTLLRAEENAPYVVVNYARLPGGVIPFMLQQVLRPSFHRYVRTRLKEHRLTSLPLFVRNLPLGPADA